MKSNKLIKGLIVFSRLFLGLVFTFSGFVKAVDPVGLQIKFTDYFSSFGMEFMIPFTLILAFILSGLEFLVGISLIFNIKPKLASLGALIFMLIFTPLTLYIALYNPVSDCGCFGDAIKLSNWQTFSKNIILFILAIFLYTNSKKAEIKRPNVEWIFISVFSVIILVFQWYNLSYLPVIDFRPFAVGTHLHDKMIIPEDAEKDSVTTYLFYEKNGKRKKFTMDNYPWEDTTWHWVKTKTHIVHRGYIPPIHDFNIYPFDPKKSYLNTDSNIVDQILADRYVALIISHNLKKADVDKLKSLKNIMNYCMVHKINSYLITASNADDIVRINAVLPYFVNYATSDGTALKTIVRSNPGLVLLKKGTVIAKWHYNKFPDIEEFSKLVK